MSAYEFVAATASKHKLDEIRQILGPRARIEARPAELPEVLEDAPTLEGNAALKAHAIAKATGRAALADDTGLEVDALGGEPGVFTARYAGVGASDAENVAKLLAELASQSENGQSSARFRTARFRTVMMVAWPDGTEIAGVGSVEGTIAHEPRGDSGFGYDPVFVPNDGDGSSFAQMQPEAKNALSHRRRALEDLVAKLEARASG